MPWKIAFFETEILEFLSLKFLLLILKKKQFSKPIYRLK